MTYQPTHAELVERAAAWLKSRGYKAIMQEPVCPYVGEIPDAIGWMRGSSCVIECKASRADYLVDRKKPFRNEPGKGMGARRFYLCPAQLVSPQEVPGAWGLLWAYPTKIMTMKPEFPFRQYNLGAEIALTAGILRRVEIDGHLDQALRPYEERMAMEGGAG